MPLLVLGPVQYRKPERLLLLHGIRKLLSVWYNTLGLVEMFSAHIRLLHGVPIHHRLQPVSRPRLLPMRVSQRLRREPELSILQGVVQLQFCRQSR